ncbi:DUF4314 domain-containing protein [Haloferax sp. Q22]|uniref:DUF4314 domain-containing protein n=1 Tax=Haloferax sp. (strain Q22) TaxID=1526048 RepID=UPI00373FE447
MKLIHTEDEYTELEKGDKGTVTGTSEIPPAVAGQPEKQIHVDWDNGSTLSLIQRKDEYEIINDGEEQ